MADKVLILDGYLRNSIAILRSLGSKGFDCDILVEKNQNFVFAAFEKAFRSKYARRVFELTEDSDDGKAELIEGILENGNYTALLAGGTYYSNFISKYKERFSQYTNVLSEDYDKMMLVHNKDSCMAFASKHGIRTPRTFTASNKDELRKVADATNGVVIVKFNDSYASRGLIKYTSDSNHFYEAYQRDFGFQFEGDNFPLIQELIEGELIDSTAFSINGEPKAILTQKREMTAWLEGGGGIVNLTVDESEVKSGTDKLLRELGWTGHIEMDWIKQTETGEGYLIEINPKFWGTTQLTIDAGFDYPFWFVQHASGNENHYSDTHVVGMRYRWLNDEFATIFTQPKSLGSFVSEFGQSVKRNFAAKTRGNFYLDDPLPFVKQVVDAFILIFKVWIGVK